MKVWIEGNFAKVSFPFDRQIVNMVGKAGLGMKWNPTHKEWSHPLTYNFASSFIKMFPDVNIDCLEKYIPQKDTSTPILSDYLMQHQRNAALKAAKHPRYAFFHQTGTGKTITGIEIIKNKGVRALVVCPLSIIETAWMEEDINNFAPEIKAVNLWEYRKATSKRKKGILKKQVDSAQVGIINFESFKLMEKELIKMDFKTLIVDESQAAKEPKSAISKRLIVFADQVPYVYLLSGTPAPNSPLEYFCQIRMLDQGVFGSNYYSFRKKYSYQSGYGGFKWKMKKEMMPEFLEKLAQFSEVVRKEDVLDLPERTYRSREVNLSSKEMVAYKEMEANLLIEIDEEEISAANAAVKLGKLRQASSGFFYNEAKEGIQVGTSKLKELLKLLEEIGDSQVIIWTQFRYEADQISKALAEKAVVVDGSIPQGQKIENIKDFKSGKVQYVIAHPKSMGHGQTLTNCSYSIDYSLSFSLELYEQSKDRIYRKGQKNRCTYYHLLAKNTVDATILDALSKKQKVADAILNHIRG
ncbi:MAG: DEAD/DEAH box helicase [Thermodesulfobacteriota bacterium]|nr:DEAD/DEAH box helicase [Thermodesulfobacteriota bacterium]